MTFSRTKLLTTLALIASVLPCSAYSTYSQSVASWAGNQTISGSTHGLGCLNFAPYLEDSNGQRWTSAQFAFSINPASYDITFFFNSGSSGAFTGTVYLEGCFAPTTATTDFEVTLDASHNALVCSACATAYAERTVSALNYLLKQTVTIPSPGNSVTGNLYLWLDGSTGSLVEGFSYAGTDSQAGGIVTLYSVSGFPSSGPILRLAHLQIVNGVFTVANDDRPF